MEEEPVTIHSLPKELLHYTLSFLSLDHSQLDLEALKSASLVHSSWTRSAQLFIHQAGAELLTPEDVDSYIRTSERRRRGPRELAVHAHRSMAQLESLFEVACKDGELRMLMIAAPTRDLDPAVLRHPNLRNVRQLILQGWFTAPSVTPLRFPFAHLDSLVLHDLTPRGRSSLHHFLVALASSPDLTRLSSISLPSIAGPKAAESIAQALVPLVQKNGLKHLGLGLSANDRPLDPSTTTTTAPASSSSETPFIPVLEAASTTLHSFESTTLPSLLLPHLPPSLRVLATMEDASRIDPSALIDVLFKRCEKLERLYFACARGDFERRERGREAIELAKGRGIEWRFGGEHDDDGRRSSDRRAYSRAGDSSSDSDASPLNRGYASERTHRHRQRTRTRAEYTPGRSSSQHSRRASSLDIAGHWHDPADGTPHHPNAGEEGSYELQQLQPRTTRSSRTFRDSMTIPPEEDDLEAQLEAHRGPSNESPFSSSDEEEERERGSIHHAVQHTRHRGTGGQEPAVVPDRASERTVERPRRNTEMIVKIGWYTLVVVIVIGCLVLIALMANKVI
ncbi:hypothetical protein JCM10908_005157 [Rhodotorula pacifica]|uniref:uncharacterized protein n=1 Tax=Rhodotorula pacifica TaxID=1495444 RepID=UPI0031782663